MKDLIKKIFWKLPIKAEIKNKISQKRYEKKLLREKIYDNKNHEIRLLSDEKELKKYVENCFMSYKQKSEYYKEYKQFIDCDSDVDLIAYYLTQFYPNEKNDKWWGKGTTEWNNVNSAVPQFCGHYQPRKPGELGYYDLRIKENFARQIDLAKNYGINVFCYYYYWFDEERLLDFPLNMFLRNKDLNINFCYCWANENWTRRFSGTDDDVLMKITNTEDNYKRFIADVENDFLDNRYYCIKGKPILLIYRPSLIPNPTEVIKYWRKHIKDKIGKDIYLVAVQEKNTKINWEEIGFDAETEFQPKQIQHYCKNIVKKVKPLRKDFSGNIYDYSDMVKNKKYVIKDNTNKKVYPAVMPMWDNTARRNFRGTIFHNSSPKLYFEWLKDVIKRLKDRKDLDKKIVFINAWNEWGEGAYLEPDEYYGYAYLEATHDALSESNTKEEHK